MDDMMFQRKKKNNRFQTATILIMSLTKKKNNLLTEMFQRNKKIPFQTATAVMMFLPFRPRPTQNLLTFTMSTNQHAILSSNGSHMPVLKQDWFKNLFSF